MVSRDHPRWPARSYMRTIATSRESVRTHPMTNYCADRTGLYAGRAEKYRRPRDKMMGRMSTLRIKVIVGSSRANRFSEKVAQWIYAEAQKRTDLDVELLDLRDYPLPFFEEPMPPGLARDGYTNPDVVKWR